MNSNRFRWTLLVTGNVVLWGVLSFYQTSRAAPPHGQLPFANAVEQRNDMIRELREIKTLLKEQNVLLRASHPTASRQK